MMILCLIFSVLNNKILMHYLRILLCLLARVLNSFELKNYSGSSLKMSTFNILNSQGFINLSQLNYISPTCKKNITNKNYQDVLLFFSYSSFTCKKSSFFFTYSQLIKNRNYLFFQNIFKFALLFFSILYFHDNPNFLDDFLECV